MKVFQGGLIVFAALQIHEARTALVFLHDEPCTTFVVRIISLRISLLNLRRRKGCGGPHTLWARVKPFLIVVPCIISAAFLVLLFYIRELYSEFGCVTDPKPPAELIFK